MTILRKLIFKSHQIGSFFLENVGFSISKLSNSIFCVLSDTSQLLWTWKLKMSEKTAFWSCFLKMLLQFSKIFFMLITFSPEANKKLNVTVPQFNKIVLKYTCIIESLPPVLAPMVLPCLSIKLILFICSHEIPCSYRDIMRVGLRYLKKQSKTLNVFFGSIL